MKIFLLGAGKPAFGNKPSALKQVSFSTTVLDWIINSFKSFASQKNIHFLGGYNIDEIIKKYPKLNFTLVTNWEKNSILNTLFHANFTDSEILISYTDTIFRKNVILRQSLGLKAQDIYFFKLKIFFIIPQFPLIAVTVEDRSKSLKKISDTSP